jgi:ABC-2 type transport system ATP-binding protein
MKRPYTLDAVIQGRRVRVVTKDGGEGLKADLGDLFQETNPQGAGLRGAEPPEGGLVLTAAEPRFEDAFMDMLGGAKLGKAWNSVVPASRKSAARRSGTDEATEVSEAAGVDEANRANEMDRANEEIVHARNLTKKFGSFTAVDGVSFSIRRGEIFGLLGPNGAGKSTTFKMMCGLLRPTSGECAISGIDFRKAPGRARSRLGYMAQKFSLYGDLNVRQNLEFFSGAYGLEGSERKSNIDRVVEIFGLSRYLKAPAYSLPPGYKQRLAMACAVMHGPDVLFLDEPTSGVDPVTRREFWTTINGAALNGVTVMVTTHFMDEAEYCDRIALVFNGQISAAGSPDELKSGAADASNPEPTLEEAFIKLVSRGAQGREP